MQRMGHAYPRLKEHICSQHNFYTHVSEDITEEIADRL